MKTERHTTMRQTVCIGLIMLCGCATSQRPRLPTGVTSPVKLQTDAPLVVKKILPVDCRLVRGFTHAPVDGRTDTRYPTGSVGEWCGPNGVPAVNYRVLNGNNGLHITLTEDEFDALQIRGGWQGKIYADVHGLMPPTADTEPLCVVQTQTDEFRQVFAAPVRARQLSFFYAGKEPKPLADVTVLRLTPGRRGNRGVDAVTFGVGDSVSPDAVFGRAIERRFGAGSVTRGLVPGQDTDVTFAKDRPMHLFTPVQDRTKVVESPPGNEVPPKETGPQ